MSIRLRLTLLYSGILLLSLVVFGVLIYVVQAQATIAIEKQALVAMSQRLADSRLLRSGADLPRLPGDASDRYIQIRSPDGQEITGTQTPGGVVLPLSDDALQAAQRGEVWVEAAQVAGERLLIRTVPIMADGVLTEILQVGRSLAVRDESIRVLGLGLLAGGIVATFAAFGLGWVLAGMALRPIQRLTETAQAIGAERDLTRRVEHTGPNDEVGRLATTFNAMLAELQAAYQQVEQALEMQRRFVADVSHELRTPLTTLNGNIELLHREPPISGQDRAEVLSDMTSESKRLIRLVNDLLALARADARRPLHNEPVRIKPIIKDACRQASSLAPDRPITCDPSPDVAVLAEADALKQVLLILLDNALKHTGGEITIAAQATEERVVMSVRDTGPGIEPDLLPHLFERFSRGKTGQVETGIGTESEIGAEAGLGLGLAIARALVEAQNGTIAVESQVGLGSVFTVVLPRATMPRETR